MKQECSTLYLETGLYSACPVLVPNAHPLNEVSFEEAAELLFFGEADESSRDVFQAISRKQPIEIRARSGNTQHVTRVHCFAEPSPNLIRGVTCLSGMTLCNLIGSGMKGVPGTASRAFGALSRIGVSVVTIAQSSSEYSISFCIKSEHANKAVQELQSEFSREISNGKIEALNTLHNVTILSIVGDRMREKVGVAGTFFTALSSINVNIIAIAQGASERSISAVILDSDKSKAVRKTHEFFFNTLQNINVYLAGTGSVGTKLLEQIYARKEKLLEQNINIRVCGIANTKGVVLNESGIPAGVTPNCAISATHSNISSIASHVKATHPLNAVFVDCTNDENLARNYTEFFQAGCHIVTSSKKANTQSVQYYDAIRVTADKLKRRFLYETNVGAGLPVIESLKNLLKSGDTLLEFQGIMSGSLSFLFGLIEQGIPFSIALEKAMALKFTEPDPRDDLLGTDVARKLLILARETGLRLELGDIEVQPVLPAHFNAQGDVSSFVQRTQELNSHFQELASRAAERNSKLRYVASISNRRCQVGIKEVPVASALAEVKGGENAFAFLSQRYSPTPLVIRGYGAGPEVTAAGIFADILKTVFWNMDTPS